MTITKRLLLTICCIFTGIFIKSSSVSAAPTLQRIGGNDRYETALKVSQNNWSTADTIILVNGENFPDALSASPLSKKYNAPILLTSSVSIDTNIKQEIQRLGAKKAFVIGGTGVLSQNIESQLNSMNISSTRLYGQDRYETSIKVAEVVGMNNGAFITSGENFADAVSTAPIAASKQMPILLTTSESMPLVTKNFISGKSGQYYVVGGEGVISSNSIGNIISYKRLSGIDRYETNAAVINEFSSSLNFSNTYLANGEGFADALSGSAAASKTSSPIIIVSDYFKIKDNIVKNNLGSISKLTLLGGTGVLSDALVNKIISGKVTTICIDPGHGGYDSGAVGPTGVFEKNVNLAIALKAGNILSRNGIELVYTRTGDSVSWPSETVQDLQARCDISNNANADYFVSIHANSADASSANGSETYYYVTSEQGGKLAQSIQSEISSSVGLLDRGVKTANFYVLKNTAAPSVLIETGFISNPREEALLNSSSFQDKMAEAIASGIIKFLNK